MASYPFNRYNKPLDRVLIYLTVRGATWTYFLLIGSRSACVWVNACFNAVNSPANNGSTGSLFTRQEFAFHCQGYSLVTQCSERFNGHAIIG